MSARRRRRAAAVFVIAAAVAVGLSACGKQESVCVGRPATVLIAPMTSRSDIAVSRAYVESVTAQAAERAAQSCGAVAAGIIDVRAESDLVLTFEDIRPKRRRAPNRAPDLRRMRVDARRWYAAHLERPLMATGPTSGSPFLGALAKIAAEPTAVEHAPLTIALIGDGTDIEPAPSGNPVDFLRHHVDVHAALEFVPLLKPLRGSCVLLLGAGAQSKLPAQILRRNRRLLGRVLKQAGIGFAATRSAQMPTSCKSTV